ncbi:probable serine/threonine-protein kinase PBL15 isoform X1 [Rhododendron vialii]|uniref:probable serine/threonine-protein kinase PBL15 isoform X1 n=1 Tax=Rhododendron vialii TaxID=182163 RepID=UPI00265ED75D|nr:probable serine/threonine-protein kinase PBL15 isoform X1 [Rhododendron vialii]
MGSSSPESPLPKKARFLQLDASIFSADGMLHGKDMLSPKPRKYQEAELEKLTNNYDEKYFIGRTQFGKLYRAKIDSHVTGAESRYVTVKIWDQEQERFYREACCNVMYDEEVRFLRDPTVNHHPNLVKFIGYCPGEVKGVVYDLDPIDTLHNLTRKESFTWPQSIKTILCFARLLEFLHGQAKPYLLLNINAAHIVLDQDWNPILLDFSIMSGGVLGERGPDKKHIFMSVGYVDPFLISPGYGEWWEAWSDVFSFGVVLLGTIAKRVLELKEIVLSDTPLTDEWAKIEYKDGCSLVHRSLAEDPYFEESDGTKITTLGMQCIDDNPERRPTMKEAVERLKSLLVVQRHADALGV